MPNTKAKRLHAWGRDSDVWVSVDVTLGSSTLVPEQMKQLVSQAKRKLLEFYENLPYSNFGVDNVEIKNRKL